MKKNNQSQTQNRNDKRLNWHTWLIDQMDH